MLTRGTWNEIVDKIGKKGNRKLAISTKRPPSLSRARPSLAAVMDNFAFLTGGYHPEATNRENFGSVEAYDIRTETWS